jgi:4-hydroxy-3-polyprenylbenzoate decarboxylase
VKRIVVGISGARGAIYGIRLLEVLPGVDRVETHLVLSPAARRTITLETDFSPERVQRRDDHATRTQRRDDHATPQRH